MHTLSHPELLARIPRGLGGWDNAAVVESDDNFVELIGHLLMRMQSSDTCAVGTDSCLAITCRNTQPVETRKLSGVSHMSVSPSRAHIESS